MLGKEMWEQLTLLNAGRSLVCFKQHESISCDGGPVTRMFITLSRSARFAE